MIDPPNWITVQARLHPAVDNILLVRKQQFFQERFSNLLLIQQLLPQLSPSGVEPQHLTPLESRLYTKLSLGCSTTCKASPRKQKVLNKGLQSNSPHLKLKAFLQSSVNPQAKVSESLVEL